MAENSHNIHTLNSLIATTIDSVDGYRESASALEDPALADRFTALAGERSSLAENLRAEVRSLGGNPEDDGTLLAAGHRAFLDLKAAVTGRDREAIIAEVERGEDHIKAKFEAALADEQLTGDARAAVERAYQSVRAGHDQASRLKHDLDA